MSKLLIVESKSKCSKIEGYLGKGYKCMASLGHIYELEKGLQAIDIADNFNPKYRLMADKRSIVGDLQRAAKRAEIVYLAADPDREGEAIALHLSESLKIPNAKLKRITFNEITQKAILAAIGNPREIDIPLCNAQKARRVLDRLFGFTISPVLWDHVGKGLSAGRCQSPALDIICRRELEINAFASNMFYSLFGDLESKLGQLAVKYDEKISNKEACCQLLEFLLVANYMVDDVTKKDRKSNPPPPHTTSTLQQEASNRLSMNPKNTMKVAQKLYERGHITYMRTDSTCLSDDAKKNISTHISKTYGKEYLTPRNYASKAKNTQEAHEAIRPVKVSNSPEMMKFSDPDEKRLYDIIWKRAVASQMTERRYTQQILTILATVLGKEAVKLFSDEEVTTFQGYEILYQKPLGKITELKQGDTLEMEQFKGEERDTKPKPRYTEASLVKELESSGIGRPSTFSNIVSTLLDRNYVEHGKTSKQKVEKTNLFIKRGQTAITDEVISKAATSEKGKLKATELGLRVREFLNNHFTNILSEQLTSTIEDRLDCVAEGNDCWVSVVREFYESFYPTVVKMSPGNSSLPNKKVNELGNHGKYSYAIINTKFGLALSKTETGKKTAKPKYLPICKELYSEGNDLQLTQVKTLFKFPRTIKYDCGTEISFCYGKNGFYLKHPNASMSLDGDFSQGSAPHERDMAGFLEMIKTKSETNEDGLIKKGIIKTVGKFNICNGPYGPFVAYIKGRARPVSVPKDVDPESLSEKDCQDLFQKRKQNYKKGSS